MLETILRAYFEGVLIGMYTFAILEVFCGSYCSMIFRFAGKKLNFFCTLSHSLKITKSLYSIEKLLLENNHGQKK